MAKIITLTPNPVLDIATSVDRLIPERKMRCGPVRRDPGGGGINVARVVHRLGGKAWAVYPAGGSAGEYVQRLLAKEGVPQKTVPVSAITREIFNVTDSKGDQYRFILPGEALRDDEWPDLITVCLGLLSTGDYLVGSGSVPPGVPDDFYARAIRAAKDKGVKTVVDTQGASLSAVLKEHVGLLKVSAGELSACLGHTPTGITGWRDACDELIKAGKANAVAVTLGEGGAVLSTGAQAWSAMVPKITPRTTVGAGDSFLGGLLAKLETGVDYEVALRYAAAAGTAALLATGTGLADPAQIEKLNPAVTITAL
jgi:6-phosphofructokinase 2